MRRYTEEWGARNDVLRQALLYPKDLSYEAFFVVVPPSQLAVARRLLQVGYLVKDEEGNISLSPLVKSGIPPLDWDAPMKVFYQHLGDLLFCAVYDYRKAERWAKKAKNDPEQLYMMVCMNSRDKSLSPFEQRLAAESLRLFNSGKSLFVLSKDQRELLIKCTIGIEQRKNKDALRHRLDLFLPTLENAIQKLPVPEDYLYLTYDLLFDACLDVGHPKTDAVATALLLLRNAQRRGFDQTLRGSSLGQLFNPKARNQSVGALLELCEKTGKDDTNEE